VLSAYFFTLIDFKGSAPAATGSRGYPAAAPPGITFDRFVRACVVVKQLTESFSSLDGDRDGWIQLSYEKFMETILSLP
jgi:peflin